MLSKDLMIKANYATLKGSPQKRVYSLIYATV